MKVLAMFFPDNPDKIVWDAMGITKKTGDSTRNMAIVMRILKSWIQT